MKTTRGVLLALAAEGADGGSVDVGNIDVGGDTKDE